MEKIDCLIKRMTGKRIEPADYYLKTKELPNSFVTESYQKLIINLDYANTDGQYKVIQFASTLDIENKTSFISNFSFLLSQKGKKVCLVDLDFRNPKLHLVFNEQNQKGLSDYLTGHMGTKELIKHSKAVGIDYILAGKLSSSVVNALESQKLHDLIEQLRQTYDYVLLDTPPVIAVADALYVAKLSDGIIFLVAQEVAKKTLVTEAIETFKANQVNFIGIVLTQAILSKGDYDHRYAYSPSDQKS